MHIAGMLVALISGGVAGTAFAGALLALGLVTRALAITGSFSPRGGWALTLGAGIAAFMYMAGIYLPLGSWIAIAALTLGGAFVGMISASLAELLELLPMTLVHTRLPDLAVATVIALMLGKAAGAILAALSGM